MALLTGNEKKLTISIPEELSEKMTGHYYKQLDSLIGDKPGSLTLNCSSLEFVSLNHINLLLHTNRLCLDNGIELLINASSGNLLHVLKVLGLYDLFKYERTPPKIKPKKEPVKKNKPKSNFYFNEFENNEKSIKSAFKEFLAFIDDFTLSDETAFKLSTVFYELTKNIQTHSELSQKDFIIFTAKINDPVITLIFADSGIPFDPTKHENHFDPKKTTSSHQLHGLGLTLVKNIADKISYNRKLDMINVLTLEINGEI